MEGYGIYLSNRQLDEAVDTAGGSPTKLMRHLIGVFFTRDVLASSSVYGKGKNPSLDRDIVSACLSKFISCI